MKSHTEKYHTKNHTGTYHINMANTQRKEVNNMVHIKFEYRDEWTGDHWSQQECTVNSIQECKDLYGLDEIEYRILEVKEVK